MANAMKLFYDSSGLKINTNKTKALASRGVQQEVRAEISSIAPIPFVSNLGRYLSFPLHGGRNHGGRFNFMLENVHKKLVSWKTNMLSMAGRVY